MDRLDWPALRGAVVGLVTALSLGAAAAGGALWLHGEAAHGHERQKERLAAVRSRYHAIDEQRRLIETWLPAFRALQAEGVIGEERRLAWIETLRKVAERVALPALRYRIAPRAAYGDGAGSGPGLDAGPYRLYSTVVHLEMDLLHEGDLERLVRELAMHGEGLWRIERCDVQRTGPELVMRAGAVNLSARCDVRWITLVPDEART